MKINWGTGIVIAFALFITFILYFVFKVQSDSQYDNELVVEEYYKQELKFENQMEKEQNAIDMTDKINNKYISGRNHYNFSVRFRFNQSYWKSVLI